MAQTSTHSPSSVNASHGSSVSVAALLRPTAGRDGAALREGELHKPDLATYIVMCLLLFLLVLLIVFFINCQLRNSFFASMPYDRSLRELCRAALLPGPNRAVPCRAEPGGHVNSRQV
uniref:Small integral membrane protein 32 n=1 Tax=Mola mola TaxID=94237 RepID=A0A3Q4AJ37_MOLML